MLFKRTPSERGYPEGTPSFSDPSKDDDCGKTEVDVSAPPAAKLQGDSVRARLKAERRARVG